MPGYRHIGLVITSEAGALSADNYLPRLLPFYTGRMTVFGLGKRLSLQPFADNLGRYGFHERPEVITTGSYYDLLQLARERGIDLIATEVEQDHHLFTRTRPAPQQSLIREASCSLLLFRSGQNVIEPWSRIVFLAEMNDAAHISLSRAIRLAEAIRAERITALRVMPTFARALVTMDSRQGSRMEENRPEEREEAQDLLRDFIDAAGTSAVPVEPRIAEGNPGFFAAGYVREVNADLLVLPASSRPIHFLQRLFPSDMEWVLREIPCNIWICREAELPE